MLISDKTSLLRTEGLLLESKSLLCLNKLIYMDTSLSSKAREVTAHLVAREKIAVTE